MRNLLIAPLLCVGSISGCSGGKDTAPSDTGPSTSDTAPGTTDTDIIVTDPTGACGDVTVYDMTLVGGVRLFSGGPAPYAHVWLEDRGWAPQVEVLGEAYTDADGLFTLYITGLTSVEGCWGTLLDYVAVAERDIQYGEREMNAELYGAISDGTLVADITAFPIEMEDTSL